MTDPDSIRSIAVCGDRIRFFRIRLGLSQAQLAARSGYSDRLIRKAESSQPISRQTLMDICDALSDEKRRVSIDDLRSSPVNVVKQFLESYDLYFDRMLEHNSQLLADAFCIRNSGPPGAPYTGTWHGISGFQDWLNILSSIVDRPIRGKIVPILLTDGEYVSASYSDHFAAKGGQPEQLWISLHFRVIDGQIVLLDNQYDTFLASKLEADSQKNALKTAIDSTSETNTN